MAKVVRLLAAHESNNAGEVCSFADGVADALVASQKAEHHAEATASHAEYLTTRGGTNPAAEAEVLAEFLDRVQGQKRAEIAVRKELASHPVMNLGTRPGQTISKPAGP